MFARPQKAHCKVSADVVSTPEILNIWIRNITMWCWPNTLARWQGRVLKVLRERDRRIPVIFLTDKVKPETVAELLTGGAADCVDRDHVGHLPVAIRRALSENNLREERDQSEKKLRHSEARYRALVGNLSYGMCRCDMKGKFLDVNQALVTMLGYSSKRRLMAAHYASEVLSDASKREQLLGRAPGGMTEMAVSVWKLTGSERMKRRLEFDSADAKSVLRAKRAATRSSSRM